MSVPSISQMTHWRLRWCQSSVHPWHPLLQILKNNIHKSHEVKKIRLPTVKLSSENRHHQKFYIYSDVSHTRPAAAGLFPEDASCGSDASSDMVNWVWICRSKRPRQDIELHWKEMGISTTNDTWCCTQGICRSSSSEMSEISPNSSGWVCWAKMFVVIARWGSPAESGASRGSRHWTQDPALN